MLKKALFAACLLLCVAPAMAQSRAEMQQLSNAWTTTFSSGNAAAVAAMYAEDAYVLPDHALMVRGRAAIEALWKTEMQQVGNVALNVIDVAPLGGNAAREIGTYTLTLKSQPPQAASGKYVVVWRKIGGRWLVVTDTWNEDK